MQRTKTTLKSFVIQDPLGQIDTGSFDACRMVQHVPPPVLECFYLKITVKFDIGNKKMDGCRGNLLGAGFL